MCLLIKTGVKWLQLLLWFLGQTFIYTYLYIHLAKTCMRKNDLITRHPKSLIYYPIIFLLRFIFPHFSHIFILRFLIVFFCLWPFYIEAFFFVSASRCLYYYSPCFFPLFLAFFFISHARHTLLVLFQYKTEKMT